MPVTVTYRGIQYTLPTKGEPNWDGKINAFLGAVVQPDTLELVDPVVTPEPIAGKVVQRSNETRLQVSEDGAPFQSVLPGEKHINVADYGAVGDGSTDDTAAIQDALNELSCDFDTGVGGSPGTIYFPHGTYRITAPLVFLGSRSYGQKFYSNTAANPGGAYFYWDGPSGADQSCFIFYGLCSSLIEGFSFSTNQDDVRGLWIRSAQHLGYGGSSHNIIRRCNFGGCSGTVPLYIAIGDAAPHANAGVQVDHQYIYDCSSSGPVVNPNIGTFVKQLSGGNTKNVYVYGGTHVFLSCILDSFGSGRTELKNFAAAEVDFPMLIGGAFVATIEGGQIEGCKRLAEATSSTNPGVLTVKNNQVYYDTEDPQDDVGLEAQCLLTLEGNHFFNQGLIAAWTAGMYVATGGCRYTNDGGKVYECIGLTGDQLTAGSGGPTGTSSSITDNHVTWKYIAPAVTIDGDGRRSKISIASSIGSSCYSVGNYFKELAGTQDEYAPFYTGSNNALGADGVNSYAQVTDLSVWSFGDKIGELGSTKTCRAATGTMLNTGIAMLANPHPKATIKGLGELHLGMNRLEFTYADFQTAATNLEISLGVFSHCLVRFTAFQATTAFAGPATVTAKLSTTANGEEVIEAKSIKVTTYWGDDVADLNTAGGKFWEVATCHPGGGKKVAAGSDMKLRLDGASNLSNLNAGVLVVWIEIARIFGSV